MIYHTGLILLLNMIWKFQYYYNSYSIVSEISRFVSRISRKSVSKSSFNLSWKLTHFLYLFISKIQNTRKLCNQDVLRLWSTKTGFVPEVHWPRTAAIYNVPERVNKQTVPPSIFHFTVLQLYCGANQQNYYTGRWHKHSNKIGTSRLINVSPLLVS